MAKITEQLSRIEFLLQMNTSDALWTLDHLCVFFSRSKNTVRQHIITQGDFPKPFKVPGIQKPYWHADEVKEWANVQKRCAKPKS